MDPVVRARNAPGIVGLASSDISAAQRCAWAGVRVAAQSFG